MATKANTPNQGAGNAVPQPDQTPIVAMPTVKQVTPGVFAVGDSDSGEVLTVKYLDGYPKQYRFNAQTGRFNLHGETDLGNKLVVQPIAYRIFDDTLFERGRVEQWVELFFVDEVGCLSIVTFNNTSVSALFNLFEPLFYNGLTLTNVVMTITAEKKENNKITPKGIYYIAKFAFQPADEQSVNLLSALERQTQPHRKDTLTDTAVHRFFEGSFFKEFVSSLPATSQVYRIGNQPAEELSVA